MSEQTNKTFQLSIEQLERKYNMKNMTVKDAINFKNYFEVAFEDGKPSNASVEYANACSLVDDYDFLVALITERCGGATGKINFKVLENYTSDEVNQMIDNYIEEALIA